MKRIRAPETVEADRMFARTYRNWLDTRKDRVKADDFVLCVPTKGHRDIMTLWQYKDVKHKALFVQEDELSLYKHFESDGWELVSGDWSHLYYKRNAILDWFSEHKEYHVLVLADDDVRFRTFELDGDDYKRVLVEDPARLNEVMSIDVLRVREEGLDAVACLREGFPQTEALRSMNCVRMTRYVSMDCVFLLSRRLVSDWHMRFTDMTDLPEDLVFSLLCCSIPSIRISRTVCLIKKDTTDSKLMSVFGSKEKHKALTVKSIGWLDGLSKDNVLSSTWKDKSLYPTVKFTLDAVTVSKFRKLSEHVLDSHGGIPDIGRIGKFAK